MNRLIRSAAFALMLMPAMGSAQDFAVGFEAYEAGDFATALREWIPLAEQGDALAQYNLGQMYRNGSGVPQDYAEAAKLYRPAAESGVIDAQNNLGYMYSNGQGVPQDYAEAVKWYRLAAEQGDALAQTNLGTMYANGQGLLEDYETAHVWFNIGAANGDTDAAAFRDKVAALLLPADISEAQRRAKVCMASGYQDCD
jgi:TPR repeat protein